MDAKQLQSFTSFASLSIYMASVIFICDQLRTRVPEPYMDEIFHIEQAKTYCAGQWSKWNNVITTPPGLYIVPSFLHQALPNWYTCSTDHLRWTNAALLCVLPILISRILSHYRTAPYPPRPGVKPRVRFLIPEDEIIWEAIVISCFPITYFFGLLYYTDLGSLVAVLASYDQSLVGHHWISALLGLWSCAFRQTNILWVAFIAGSALINRLRQLNSLASTCPKSTKPNELKPAHNQVKPYDVFLIGVSPTDLPRALFSLVNEISSHLPKTLPVILPYAAVLVCFVIFVIWNQGIVLGDKSNHMPVLHIPQVYYFASFSVAFLAPVSFHWSPIMRYFRSPFKVLTQISSFKSFCLCLIILVTIHHCTYEHPFLLSDNRHYTFYVWRRIFKLHQSVKYLLTPGYMLGIKIIFRRLARSHTTNLLITTFYVIALAFTLIPSPLIEPRYFLVPYVLLRLHVRPVVGETETWPTRVMVEGCLYGIINLITIAVFLYRPFAANPGEWQGIWQRFMW